MMASNKKAWHDFHSERKGIEAPPLEEPLGGYIFVCNDETMANDIQRNLFGLPHKYFESVRNIKPGMPLFLYNYSRHQLHGIFEASSAGSYELDPTWEVKDTRNGKPASRFPSQVRVRLREARPPLDAPLFRDCLYLYDGPKFRLQLSAVQASELLALFGRPEGGSEQMEVAAEGGGAEGEAGEWERVKIKGKNSRNLGAYRTSVATRAALPNGLKDNKGVGNGGGRVGGNVGERNHGGNSLVEDGTRMTRMKDRDDRNRADNASRWRSDPDNWGSPVGSGGTGKGSGKVESRGQGYDKEDAVGRGRRTQAVELANGIGPRQEPGAGRKEGKEGDVEEGKDGHDGNQDKERVEERGAPTSGELNPGGLERTAEPDGSAVPPPASNTNPSDVAATGAVAGAAVGTTPPKSGSGWNKNLSFAAILKGCTDEASASASQGAGGTPLSADLPTPAASAEPGEEGSLALAATPPSSGGLKGLTGKGGAGGGPSKASKVDSRSPGGTPAQVGGSEGEQTVGQGKGVHKKGMENGFAGGKGASGDSNVGSWMKKGSRPGGREGLAGAQDSPPVLSHTQRSRAASTVAKGGSSSDTAKVQETSAGSGSGEGTELNVKPAVNGPFLKLQEAVIARRPAWQGNDAAHLRRLAEAEAQRNGSGGGPGVAEGGGEGPIFPEQPAEAEVEVSKAANPEVVLGDMEDANYDRLRSSSDAVVAVPIVCVSSSSAATSSNEMKGREVAPREGGRPGPPFVSINGPIHSQPSGGRGGGGQSRAGGSRHYREQYRVGERGPPRKMTPPPTHPILHALPASAALAPPFRVSTPPLTMPPLAMYSYLPLSPRSRRQQAESGSPGYRPLTRSSPEGAPNSLPVTPTAGHGNQAGWGLIAPLTGLSPILSPSVGFPGFPMPPPNLLGTAVDLHEEVMEYTELARPSKEARARAESAVDHVRGIVRSLWPGSDVEVFGSFATGLALPHSDVDVAVVNAPPPPDNPETQALQGARISAPLIRDLAAVLNHQDWCESMYTIETARIPVIKLKCQPNVKGLARPTSGGGAGGEQAGGAPLGSMAVLAPVAMDITIAGCRREGLEGKSKEWVAKVEEADEAHNGEAAREFVKGKLQALPALAPLVLLLKTWLQHRGLNDVYTGGLGSFALTLMLVFYLERAPVAVGTPSPPPPPTDSSQSLPSTSTTPASSLDPTSTVTHPEPNPDTSPSPNPSPSMISDAKVEGAGRGSEEGADVMMGAMKEGEVECSRVGGGEVATEGRESDLSASEERGVDLVMDHISDTEASRERREGEEAEGGRAEEASDIRRQEVGGAVGGAVGGDGGLGGGEREVESREGRGRYKSIADALLANAPKYPDDLKVKKSIVEDLPASIRSVPSPSFGVLLTGFLQAFGAEIDFARVRLVLKGSNGSLDGAFWHDPSQRPTALWIDDPLRPGANIGAGSFAIWHVQASFRDLLMLLSQPLPSLTTSPTPEKKEEEGGRRALHLLDQAFDSLMAPTQMPGKAL